MHRSAGLAAFLMGAVFVAPLAGCSSDTSSTPSSAAPAGESSPARTPGPVTDLHVECSGEGSPTVVLVAGLNTSGDVFTAIADQLSGTTRTCWYDRAGIGSSAMLADDAPDPSPGSAAADLQASLAAQGVAPPYVVLGWSYGGLVTQAYVAAYPEDVAGVVLEDTSVREQFTDPYLVRVGEEQDITWAEGGRDIDQEALRAQLDDLDFGDVPLAVLSQDEVRGKFRAVWFAAHDGLARSSTDGVHVVGVGSGHEMHVDVPGLVVAAVQAVVGAAADGTHLGRCDARFTDAGGRCRTL